VPHLPDETEWRAKRRSKLLYEAGHGNPSRVFKAAAEAYATMVAPYREDARELLEMVSLTSQRKDGRRTWYYSVPVWLLRDDPESRAVLEGKIQQRRWIQMVLDWEWAVLQRHAEIQSATRDRLQELYQSGWGLYYVRRRGTDAVGPILYAKPLITSLRLPEVWQAFWERLERGQIAPQDVRRGQYHILPLHQLDYASMDPETGEDVLNVKRIERGQSTRVLMISEELWDRMQRAMREVLVERRVEPWLDVADELLGPPGEEFPSPRELEPSNGTGGVVGARSGMSSPEAKRHFASEATLLLYHGTSASYLPEIEASGLRAGTHFTGQIDIAEYYAAQTAEHAGDLTGVVLEVSAPTDGLRPDWIALQEPVLAAEIDRAAHLRDLREARAVTLAALHDAEAMDALVEDQGFMYEPGRLSLPEEEFHAYLDSVGWPEAGEWARSYVLVSSVVSTRVFPPWMILDYSTFPLGDSYTRSSSPRAPTSRARLPGRRCRRLGSRSGGIRR